MNSIRQLTRTHLHHLGEYSAWTGDPVAAAVNAS